MHTRLRFALVSALMTGAAGTFASCGAPAEPSEDVVTRADVEALNREALEHHRARRLTDASRRYARVLELEPFDPLQDRDIELTLRLAPVLEMHDDEPFELEDLVAIIHPDSGVVAYHLFWDDDIDFPDDNEPTDHEVVWVSYDRASLQPTTLRTYFHGELVEADLAPMTAEAGIVRPRVFVEWGKHGSLPSRTLPSADAWPDVLEENWTVLNTTGTRRQGHPLALGWPTRFEGDFDAYRNAPGVLDTRHMLQARRTIARTRWGNAALDQSFLPYNFSPKPAWPWEL